MKHEHDQDLKGFDEAFSADIAAFVEHLQRSFGHLVEIIQAKNTGERQHWPMAALYLWDATRSLAAAFTVLRQGYPVQGLDLARRLVESSAIAVYICDHPTIVKDERLTKLDPGKCVSYAKRHMPNIGRSYGFSSLFDHAHSAMIALLPSEENHGTEMFYPVGPSSVSHQRTLFHFALLRILADAHNLNGVIEMLFFRGLSAPKRFWTSVEKEIHYRPIEEERLCETDTARKLEEVGALMETGLLKLQKGKHSAS